MHGNAKELIVRQTFINSCSALSGAFGGLLAYGLTQIDAAGLVGWQWMYVATTQGLSLVSDVQVPH
jgi:hypothetical protein